MRAVVRTDLAFLVARVGIDRQEAGQDLSGGRACGNVRRGQREHRLVGAAGLQRQIVRRLQNVAFLRLLRFGRVDRSLPEILTGEELVGAGHMVLGQQFALHLEQAFRVTQVAHQIAGNFRQLVVLAGEDLLPGLDHRIGLVPHVQVHGTVIRVDGSLHGIANVVGVLRAQARLPWPEDSVVESLVASPRVGHLRVWVGVRSGVAVHDPLDPSVHHGRVYAAVKRQIRRDLGHTLLRGTVVENLRMWSSHGWRTGSGRSRSGWRTAVWRRCCRSSGRHRP